MGVSDCGVCVCRFVSDWVYSGVFRDVYGEFMIQVNEDCLSFRGEDAHTESVSQPQASALAVKMTVNISHTVC